MKLTFALMDSFCVLQRCAIIINFAFFTAFTRTYMPQMQKRKLLIPVFFRHEEFRNACEGKLRVKECFDCHQSFENCKSPRENDLTAEFYKTFWNSEGHLLVESLNYSNDHKHSKVSYH